MTRLNTSSVYGLACITMAKQLRAELSHPSIVSDTAAMTLKYCYTASI
jgi:hypothetical protein